MAVQDCPLDKIPAVSLQKLPLAAKAVHTAFALMAGLAQFHHQPVIFGDALTVDVNNVMDML
jgi:hypothetical protein